MKNKTDIAGIAGLSTSHVSFDDAESKSVLDGSTQSTPEYKFQTPLDQLPARPAGPKSSNTTDAYIHESLPHSVPIAGASTSAVTHQQATQRKGTDEIYGLGSLPSAGPGRWEYLANPGNWHPERRKLHEKLLDQARSSALTLAESLESDGCQPTLFALRGNTATGKTRIATKKIPVLAAALKKTAGKGCVNPDVFKSSLAKSETGAKIFSSAQVHSESSFLADRFEGGLRSQKTGSGAIASIVVDKRLSREYEIDSYIQLAKETGRKVELCDIDAPLENSLVGVLQRKPEGEDPRPPYPVVSSGFVAVRSNRMYVIDRFIADPSLGNYRLFGTAEDGEKVMVASVIGGEFSVENAELYEKITSPQLSVTGDLADKVIDKELIDRLENNIADPERAAKTRAALEKYSGKSWSAALAAHSELI
ncbi:type III effector protein XopAK (AvrRxo1) [Xanthomonas oryzae pv. oryzicola BLS256]|uniref:Type III effector protein XopAK (AvrRxo1) n=4 Tax=Xanthomonas oryzae TaxID=347 RepID=G7TIM2_XANOB|nr:zeta toxin family type III secretion system effector XopAJ/AvrRxo1 [Xanthomonas oryzae]AAQ97593.1 AvrRxo1-ORF1 [Xanthomonas oryzae pv. oryzicola]AEQ98135.1 type III effector protein XopAK (AvrRxo1) [Xanthomonas oryzae pv. oryzicola BLS256]WVN06984.1 zeta toxin family type III secretion system effector XopAJ/AvrRxo1 [Xanthomonas oryzae pv. oryzicola]